jgi:hypothetical protein
METVVGQRTGLGACDTTQFRERQVVLYTVSGNQPLIRTTSYQITDWKSLFGFDLASANQHRLFIQCGVSEVISVLHVLMSYIQYLMGLRSPEVKNFYRRVLYYRRNIFTDAEALTRKTEIRKEFGNTNGHPRENRNKN